MRIRHREIAVTRCWGRKDPSGVKPITNAVPSLKLIFGYEHWDWFCASKSNSANFFHHSAIDLVSEKIAVSQQGMPYAP